MVEKALNIFRQFAFCGISPFCHRQMGQKSIFCRVSVQYVVHGEEYLYRFCITMIIHSSQFIEITSVHCHTLEPVQFCLIVGLIVCLIFEGVTDNVKRIRRAISPSNKLKIARYAFKGKTGNMFHNQIQSALALTADWGLTLWGPSSFAIYHLVAKKINTRWGCFETWWE